MFEGKQKESPLVNGQTNSSPKNRPAERDQRLNPKPPHSPRGARKCHAIDPPLSPTLEMIRRRLVDAHSRRTSPPASLSSEEAGQWASAWDDVQVTLLAALTVYRQAISTPRHANWLRDIVDQWLRDVDEQAARVARSFTTAPPGKPDDANAALLRTYLD